MFYSRRSSLRVFSAKTFLRPVSLPSRSWRISSPNERRDKSRQWHFTLLAAPSASSCHFARKMSPRATPSVARRENVIPSSRSPYSSPPADVVSHFSSWLRSSPGLFSGSGGAAAVAYVLPPGSRCTLHSREDGKNKRHVVEREEFRNVCLSSPNETRVI